MGKILTDEELSEISSESLIYRWFWWKGYRHVDFGGRFRVKKGSVSGDGGISSVILLQQANLGKDSTSVNY